jgi:Raf kinase inhibitor-like YbhB/YbcL family protein
VRNCLAGLLVVSVLVGCSHDGRTLKPSRPDQTQSIVDPTTIATTVAPTTVAGAAESTAVAAAPFTMTGPWAEGGPIDARFTCKGTNVSPALNWSGAPADTAQFAIVVTDPDAGGFVHWVLTGIEPSISSLAEGQVPDGAVQAVNGSGKAAWSGPCPPSGTHTYEFVIHALDTALTVDAGSAANDVIGRIEGASIDSATYTGTFGS